MSSVNTVSGEIKAEELGVTLIHEHLGDAGDWCVRCGIPGWIDVEDMTGWRVKTAAYAQAVGVRSVVDCSVMNLGRYIPMMQTICDRTGLQIIAATGFYYPDMLWEYSASDDAILRILMRDIEKGMDGTTVKAGVIKCAIGSAPMTPTNERILRASAKAHLRSGVPIVTHTEYCNRGGITQQEIFEDEGVDLSRIMIGHLGDTNDIEYIETILKKGSFIGLDRFSQDSFNSFENRCGTLAALVRRGWTDRIMISHDYPLHMGKTFWEEEDQSGWEENARSLQYIHCKVLPRLKELGVTEEEIRKILIDNPRRFFGGD